MTRFLLARRPGYLTDSASPWCHSFHKEDYCIDLHDTNSKMHYDIFRRLFSYPNTHVFLILFSIADAFSLSEVMRRWIPELEGRAKSPYREPSSSQPEWILVGTHADTQGGDLTIAEFSGRQSWWEKYAVCADGFQLAADLAAEGSGRRVVYVECDARDREGLEPVLETVSMTEVILGDGVGNADCGDRSLMQLVLVWAERSVNRALFCKRYMKRGRCMHRDIGLVGYFSFVLALHRFSNMHSPCKGFSGKIAVHCGGKQFDVT